MRPFYGECKPRVDKIQMQFDEITSETKNVCTYFNSEGLELEELLDIFDTFCSDFKYVYTHTHTVGA